MYLQEPDDIPWRRKHGDGLHQYKKQRCVTRW